MKPETVCRLSEHVAPVYYLNDLFCIQGQIWADEIIIIITFGMSGIIFMINRCSEGKKEKNESKGDGSML